MIKSDLSELDKLKRKAKKLHGEQDIPYDVLFSTSFMKRYTPYSTKIELFEAGGFKFDSNEEFENLPEEKLDQHVSKSTNFNSWSEMLNKAGEHWLAKEIGVSIITVRYHF